MEHNGRLLCPLCRKTHTDGIIKPGITICVPCAICKTTYDIEQPPRQIPPEPAAGEAEDYLNELNAMITDEMDRREKQCS